MNLKILNDLNSKPKKNDITKHVNNVKINPNSVIYTKRDKEIDKEHSNVGSLYTLTQQTQTNFKYSGLNTERSYNSGNLNVITTNNIFNTITLRSESPTNKKQELKDFKDIKVTKELNQEIKMNHKDLIGLAVGLILVCTILYKIIIHPQRGWF